MSDFSNVGVDANFPLIPAPARGCKYQSKDLPDDEGNTACVDGDIRADGMFVRHDGKVNPSLNGWIRLITEPTSARYEFSLRFQDGRVIEIVDGRQLPAGSVLALHSPSHWSD